MSSEGEREPSEEVTHDDPVAQPSKPKDGGASGNDHARAQQVEARDQLASYEWDQLQRDYSTAMQSLTEEERKAFAEFDMWIKVFGAWAATTTTHENERACKRFNTRVAHVQLSENRLEKKRQHYSKVLDAFRGALEMLE